MSKSKRDILDTERMLERLTELLAKHKMRNRRHDDAGEAYNFRADAQALRRISMTLHRWHELECGDGNDHGSWCITRGSKASRKGVTKMGPHIAETFVHDDDGKPYLEHHHYRHGRGKDTVTYSQIPDRERGALARLKSIMARYPALSSYVQGDPRGCALYILKPGDVPAGEDVSAYYSRGLAVFR